MRDLSADAGHRRADAASLLVRTSELEPNPKPEQKAFTSCSKVREIVRDFCPRKGAF